jgi:cellulose synthase/poly-beta-1,6-N-acetylglucosamine synthase-like glycosyltransferase
MMPHLLNDPKMGMTCPPQYFWNIPRNDPVRQNLDYLYAVTELIHEGLGAGDCVGSGYVVRRDALNDIGGFPAFSISEDTACSSMLRGKEWSVAYIDEYLQCGEMTDTLAGHVKQRTRWTIGNVQTAFNVRPPPYIIPQSLTNMSNKSISVFGAQQYPTAPSANASRASSSVPAPS